MISNAQEFAFLVVSLRSLLERYMENTEDAEENPIVHHALLNLLLNLQFLEAYSHDDLNAKALFESIYEEHKKLLQSVQKN